MLLRTFIREALSGIRRREYRPDERAVADAILRRPRKLAALRADADAVFSVEDHAALDTIDD
jgi:hypothetical protein